jgi:predicted ester cyclase
MTLVRTLPSAWGYAHGAVRDLRRSASPSSPVYQHDVLGQAKAAAGEQVGGGVVWHGGGLGDIAGPENLAGLLRSFIGALPDLYAAEQDIIAENDLVVVRLVITATVRGTLLGMPADGKPVRWNA